MRLREFLISTSAFSLACVSAHVSADTSGESLAESPARSLVGTLAPPLILKTIDGETIDLGRLYGKEPVYLKFWATWCVPCRQQMPHFEHTYETAGHDLEVIAINSGFNDTIEDVRIYRRKLGIRMPIVVDDGRAAAAFKLRVTPQHIVIGRDGRIQYVGHLADERLDGALNRARASSAGADSLADSQAQPSTDWTHYTVGEPLPQLSAQTLDGGQFSFREPSDPRRTVLVFLSPWCESYLATSRPQMSAACRRVRQEVGAGPGQQNVRWLGIASGLWARQEDLRQYRRDQHVRIPLSLDESGDLFRAFDVTQVPTILIANGSGVIVRRIDPLEFKTTSALHSAIGTP